MNYDQILSDKIKTLKPSGIRKFFDLVLGNKEAVSLGVGEPDFITPWSAREAAIKSIQDGYTQYTSNSGLPALREKICEYLKVRFNLNYITEEVVITVGASEAIDLAVRALVNNGDEIIIPQPSFVSYAPAVIMSGGTAVALKCDPAQGFKASAAELKKCITPKTKALLLSYPNNPTGAIMNEQELKEIAAVVKEHDIMIITDEIYAELTYAGKHVSIASFEGMRERCILINGFSKAFAMTGWRVGYFAAPLPVAEQMLKLHQYMIMCAPTCSQFAALQALKDGLSDGFAVVEEMREEYNNRRRLIYDAFKSMGLNCCEPLGAFYIFPEVSSTGLDGEGFSMQLLEKKKVAVVPGNSFGDCGKNFIRCSYAYSLKTLNYALDKIAEFVKELKS